MRRPPNIFAVLLLAGWACCSESVATDGVLVLERVSLDGRAVPLPAIMEESGAVVGEHRLTQFEDLLLPAGTRKISFELKPAPLTSGEGYRFRYRMEGQEAEWRESGGAMRLSFRFFSKDQADFFGIGNWHVRGDSPGWTGTESTSPLVPQTRLVQVPTDMDGVDVSIVSGGSMETVGILAVGVVTITRVRDGVEDDEPWAVAAFERDPSGKVADPWRNYMRGDLSEIVAHPTERGRRMLVLRDTSNTSYSEFNFQKKMNEKLQPGDYLKIAWEWSYSIGSCEQTTLSYDGISPGKYQMRIQSVSPDAQIIYEEVRIPLLLPALFYKTRWFVAVCSLLGAGLLFSVVAWNYRRRVRLKLARLEWMHRLEEERTRIARDMHDDIGSRLTLLRLIAASACTGGESPDELKTALSRILDGALEAGRKLHEIIWAVKTANDTAEALAGYITQTTEKLCSSCGMRFRLDIPTILPPVPIPSHVRYNVMLAFREALTNALKHAQATEIEVQFRLAGLAITVVVGDNGRGFAPDDAMPGDGLANMRARMAEIGGTVECDSRPGDGTQVIFRVTLGEAMA